MRGSVRHREVAALVKALDGDESVVVLGPAGSGRTILCDSVEETLTTTTARRCHRIRGTEAVPGVPYAPFAPVLDELQIPAADGLTVLTKLPPALTAARDVLIVDDADLLDQASIVLVGQIARAGGAVAVVTPGVDVLPRSMRDAIDAGMWEVLSLEPLDIDDVLAVAAELAGQELDAQSAARVIAGAQGNLRRAVALVRSMLGGATTSAAGVRLGPLVVDGTLRGLLSPDRTPDQRAVVELLASAERLPTSVLTDAERDHLDGVAVVEDGVARLVDPLLGDVTLADASVMQRQGWAREVARRLNDLPDWLAVQVLMRHRSGERVPREERRCAAGALERAHRPDDVLELLDASEEPEDLLLRGTAWSQLGALDEALDALNRVSQSPDPVLVARAAHELGLLHAVRRADPATAVSAVEALLDRTSPAGRRDLETELIKWRLMAGLPQPVDAPPRVGTSVAESLIGAMIGSLHGPLDDALRHVDAGRQSLADGAVGPTFAADVLRLSSFLVDVFAGRLSEAAATAKSYRDHAARTADPSLGMWELATSELALHDGRHELGFQVATRAQRHLAWRDFTGLGPTTVALRAAVAARTGRMALALDLAPDVEEHRGDVKVHLHLARVEAERQRQSRDDHGAAVVLSAAGQRALAEVHGHLGLMAIDEAVMVRPTATDVATLLEHAGKSAMYQLLADRAVALIDNDADALSQHVTDLEEMGLLGRAAHAAFVAAQLFDRSKAPERAKRLRTQGVLLASRSSRWACDDRAEALTGREIDIARLAANRMRSREIAQTLGLSTRTVDNHLGRVFRKLGVTSRDELHEALGLVQESS